jgi:hypothetical protein
MVPAMSIGQTCVSMKQGRVAACGAVSNATLIRTGVAAVAPLFLMVLAYAQTACLPHERPRWSGGPSARWHGLPLGVASW